MHSARELGDIDVCSKCRRALARGKQPRDSLANFQWYARERLPDTVAEAFKSATLHELQLVSACRATRVAMTYEGTSGIPGAQQRFNKGNVAIIPQDVGKLHTFLPPSPAELDFSICVVFVSAGVVPDVRNLPQLRPVFVTRNRVETMLKFLTEHNIFYKEGGVSYSAANLDAIVGPGNPMLPRLTAAIEIRQLSPAQSARTNIVNSGYVDRGDAFVDVPPDEALLETIGFVSSNRTGLSTNASKADAMRWCLGGKPYLTVRGDGRLFPDRDPRMLTFVFPQLDPFGIGGFNNELRKREQVISFERQMRNLLLLYDSPFQRDQAFPFV
ncbi:hypothetical protein FA95DRAFT_1644011, partial [Auriscalpium vulgare]